MKRNLFTLLGISMLSLLFITVNSGCSDKLRDAEEHYDIGTMHWKQGRFDDAIEEFRLGAGSDFGKTGKGEKSLERREAWPHNASAEEHEAHKKGFKN